MLREENYSEKIIEVNIYNDTIAMFFIMITIYPINSWDILK